jgi:2-iminobutanoate/2-iminopropanoate deaminase
MDETTAPTEAIGRRIDASQKAKMEILDNMGRIVMNKITYGLEYNGKKQRFAQSVVVGDLVFVSGSSGRTIETGEVSSNNIREQIKVALDKVRGALEKAGSSMNQIVKVVIYLKNMKDYEEVKQAEWDYWTEYAPALVENPPASTVVQVVSLSKPSMLIEFDITAIKAM